MPLILLLIRRTGCMYTNRIFLLNRSPKVLDSQQFFFGLRLVRRIFEETLTSRNPNQICAVLRRIFSSKKSAPTSRNKGFYTNRVPKKHEVVAVPVAVDVLFKRPTVSNGTILRLIQSGRTVPTFNINR
jgi:hypothetical protein